jgi:hypothetical protein
MPHGPMHDRQKKKNYAILLAILAFVATVFFVSIIRMKGGQ